MGDAVRYNKTLALLAAGRKRYSAASGDVISFDGDGSPLRGLTVGIEPVQSGSGDPSPDNVRPISGWTGATVFHSGADPSDPEEIAVSWADGAGTVYGGTLDVLSGVLTVDRVMLDLGEQDWHTSNPQLGIFWLYDTHPPFRVNGRYVIQPPPNAATPADFLCSKYKTGTANDREDGSVYWDPSYGKRYVGIVDTNYTDWTADQVKADLAGVQLLCRLVSPETYQLTAQQIDTLLGENRIWADTGPVSAAYRSLEDAQRSKLAVLLRNRGRDET